MELGSLGFTKLRMVTGRKRLCMVSGLVEGSGFRVGGVRFQGVGLTNHLCGLWVLHEGRLESHAKDCAPCLHLRGGRAQHLCIRFWGLRLGGEASGV